MGKVIGIVGSYREGMIIDTAVSKVLEGAESKGRETEKIYLIRENIEFCRNCRKCTSQQNPRLRGRCVIDDRMGVILDKTDSADGIVLGAPVNFGSVTAVTKRFIERLAVYAKWKLDGKVRAPEKRIKTPNKRAVIITSSTMPAVMGRIFIPRALKVMKESAELMGAKVVKQLWFGMVPAGNEVRLNTRQLRKAYKAGTKL